MENNTKNWCTAMDADIFSSSNLMGSCTDLLEFVWYEVTQKNHKKIVCCYVSFIFFLPKPEI